ncbi:MAG: hypothetical protein WBA10_01540 [Elainellaceae cyanobacterium]
MVQQEAIAAFNTHAVAAQQADIMVDIGLTKPGTQLVYRYHSDTPESPPQETVQVQDTNGIAFVSLPLPPAGMIILSHQD